MSTNAPDATVALTEPSESSAIHVNPLIDWLITVGWEIPEPAELVAQLARTMNRAGMSVARVRISLRTLHPQFIGIAYTWRRATDAVEVFQPPHAILFEEAYMRSPLAAIYEGAGAIRRRLDTPHPRLDYPVLADLKAEGATDYVAMPLNFSDGRISALTLASDRPRGFYVDELALIYEALPVLARICEAHALRMTMQTILDTFLGPASGERVLKGLIRRGDAEDIYAVLWYSDLRDSTGFADRLPRETYLKLLNDYFDCTAGAVVDRGGQVLSFLGDAVFAIFPIGSSSRAVEDNPGYAHASAAAMAAAENAIARLAVLNAGRQQFGQSPLAFGIALHLGDVSYGNIGVEQRLDFTVIGPAANEVARLAALCKVLNRPILVSAALARAVPAPFVSLGVYPLRGVRVAQEVFVPSVMTHSRPGAGGDGGPR
ncbi:MAG: adenylate/guanylate cyclase domain-containing protein [Rhodospirillales bacterium]